MAKREKILHTLQEPCVAMWAYLTTPDEYKGDKKYKLDGHYPDGATPYLKKLVQQINQIAQESLAKGKAAAKTQAQANKIELSKDVPYGKVLDDEGKPTGGVYLRFKQNAEYKDKTTNDLVPMKPPPLFDARGNPITDPDFVVGNGSIVSVHFELYPYCNSKVAGTSLKIQAVQVIKHVPYVGGVSFDKTGFQVVDSDDDDEGNPFSSTGAGDDGGGDAFGDVEPTEDEAQGNETLEGLFSNDEAPAEEPKKKTTKKGGGKGKAAAAAPVTELSDGDF
jgi:hypothetical protein